jgi:hypothetical protein
LAAHNAKHATAPPPTNEAGGRFHYDLPQPVFNHNQVAPPPPPPAAPSHHTPAEVAAKKLHHDQKAAKELAEKARKAAHHAPAAPVSPPANEVGGNFYHDLPEPEYRHFSPMSHYAEHPYYAKSAHYLQ